MKIKSIWIITGILSIILFSTFVEGSLWAEFPSNETRITKYSWFSSQKCFDGQNSYELDDNLLIEINKSITTSYLENFPDSELYSTGFVEFHEKVDDDTQIFIWICPERWLSGRLIKLRIQYRGELSPEKISKFEEMLAKRTEYLQLTISNVTDSKRCKEFIPVETSDIPTYSEETLIDLEGSSKSTFTTANKSKTVFFNINYLFIYTSKTNFQRMVEGAERLSEIEHVNKIEIKNTTLQFLFEEYPGENNTVHSRRFNREVDVPTIKVKRVDNFDSYYIFDINSTYYGNIIEGYVGMIGTLISTSLDLDNLRKDIDTEINRIDKLEKEVSEGRGDSLDFTDERQKLSKARKQYRNYKINLINVRGRLTLVRFYEKDGAIRHYLEAPSGLPDIAHYPAHITKFKSYSEVEFLNEFFSNFDTASTFAESVVIEFEPRVELLYDAINSYERTINMRHQEQMMSQIDEQIRQVDRLCKISENQSLKINELIKNAENQSVTSSQQMGIAIILLGVSIIALFLTYHSERSRRLEEIQNTHESILMELSENLKLIEKGDIIFLKDSVWSVIKNSGKASLFKQKLLSEITKIYDEIYEINDRIRTQEMYVYSPSYIKKIEGEIIRKQMSTILSTFGVKEDEKKNEWEAIKEKIDGLKPITKRTIGLIKGELKVIKIKKSYVSLIKSKVGIHMKK